MDIKYIFSFVGFILIAWSIIGIVFIINNKECQCPSIEIPYKKIWRQLENIKLKPSKDFVQSESGVNDDCIKTISSILAYHVERELSLNKTFFS
jgi:hypothetical protein